jgi:hypothetical protein
MVVACYDHSEKSPEIMFSSERQIRGFQTRKKLVLCVAVVVVALLCGEMDMLTTPTLADVQPLARSSMPLSVCGAGRGAFLSVVGVHFFFVVP